MKIAIIIPAYNEEKRITQTLQNIQEYIQNKGIDYEIIMVDDKSNDTTIETAKRTKIPLTIITNPINLGKGGAVKNGMLNANGDYLLFTDADLSTPIEELDKLLIWIQQGFDVIIGSRAIKGAEIQTRQPFYRELIGKIFGRIIVQLITANGIKDTQCGFKLFTEKSARDIFQKQTLNGFCFDVEILQIAKRKGYKIKEVPIIWKNAEGSKVNPIKDSLKMFKDLIKIKINTIKGKYD